MNLKAAAVEAGVKGVQIASHFGLSSNTVSKWLNRKAAVPDIYKIDLAAMLRVRLEDLLPPKESTHATRTSEEESSEEVDRHGA